MDAGNTTTHGSSPQLPGLLAPTISLKKKEEYQGQIMTYVPSSDGTFCQDLPWKLTYKMYCDPGR